MTFDSFQVHVLYQQILLITIPFTPTQALKVPSHCPVLEVHPMSINPSIYLHLPPMLFYYQREKYQYIMACTRLRKK